MAGGIEQLIDELERSYAETQERMSDPAVYNDHRQAAHVGGRLRELEGPYKLAQQWRRAQEDLEAAREDPELADLAPDPQEISRLEEGAKLTLAAAEPRAPTCPPPPPTPGRPLASRRS